MDKRLPKANRTKTKMAGNIDDACLDEYPRLDESFGEWVGDYDYASELDVSNVVSSSIVLFYYKHNSAPIHS